MQLANHASASRRRVLQGLGCWPWFGAAAVAAPARAATPACGKDAASTPEQTAGPFFRPRSPQRQSLREPGLPGPLLLLTGRVLAPDCQPLAGALLDFWQADASGRYDVDGPRLRGHQYTAADGTFRLETVVPGAYVGRTRHLHVKLQAPNGPVLTTQLYWPGEAGNRQDGLYDPALQMSLVQDGALQRGRFDFVLRLQRT